MKIMINRYCVDGLRREPANVKEWSRLADIPEAGLFTDKRRELLARKGRSGWLADLLRRDSARLQCRSCGQPFSSQPAADIVD
jgi:hypothetical protein